jgi:hypothetical protein
MLNKATIGLGIATMAMGAALIPAVAPASATVPRVSVVSSVRTSSLCKSYKSQQSLLSKTEGGALAKAYASGNWASIQKALLSSFGAEGSAVKNLESALKGAPSNVKAAAGTLLKFENQIKSVVQSSTTLAQFGSQITALSESPKTQAALKVLDDYGKKLCPGSVPKTPTT